MAVPNLTSALRDRREARRRDQSPRDLPGRPQPGQFPADLHPRPRVPDARRGRPEGAASTPRPRRRHDLRRRRVRQPVVRRRLPQARRRDAPRAPPRTPSPATTRSTPSKWATTSPTSKYTKAAGGREGYPDLEGVKVNGHWAVIYSKLDIGCALERPRGSTAPATSTRARCGSPPTSCCTRRCRDRPGRASGTPRGSGPFHSDSGPGNGDWLRSVAKVPVPLARPILPRKGGQARSEDSASQSPFPRQVENETALSGGWTRVDARGQGG